MLSFIIIGRNEAHNIERCLNALFHVIEKEELKDYEIIYVDSNSQDNSIEILGKYNIVHVYQITGKCSVAAGRSVGAKESRGNVLFFLDADIELLPGFISTVLDKNLQLKYDIVRGNLRNIYHSFDSKYLYTQLYNNKKCHAPKKLTHASGIFMIKKEVWNLVNGVKLKYVNAFEDYDMGLRLLKKGIWTTYVDIIMGNHYTVSHREKTRMWKQLFSGAQLYRGVLYRDHLFNIHLYTILIGMDWTAIILIACIFLSFVSPLYLLVYLFSCLFRIINHKIFNPLDVLLRLMYFFIRDISTILSFLFFYPKEFKLEYKKIS